MRQEEPATAVRDRLIAACEEKYRAVRSRDASGKRAAHGVSRGVEILRATDASGSAAAFLQTARQAIEAEKNRLRDGPDDDEDGWQLGGLTTVLNLIDAQLAAPARRRRSRRYLAIAIAVVALAGLAVLFLSATYTHIPESRLAGSDLVAAASALRTDVQEGARPPLEARETPRGRIELSVAPNGTITAVNRKFGITVVLTPDGKCTGAPTRDVPAACR